MVDAAFDPWIGLTGVEPGFSDYGEPYNIPHNVAYAAKSVGQRKRLIVSYEIINISHFFIFSLQILSFQLRCV